jgi:hypothetical protein
MQLNIAPSSFVPKPQKKPEDGEGKEPYKAKWRRMLNESKKPHPADGDIANGDHRKSVNRGANQHWKNKDQDGGQPKILSGGVQDGEAGEKMDIEPVTNQFSPFPNETVDEKKARVKKVIQR